MLKKIGRIFIEVQKNTTCHHKRSTSNAVNEKNPKKSNRFMSTKVEGQGGRKPRSSKTKP